MIAALFPAHNVVLTSNNLLFETPQDMGALTFGNYYIALNKLVIHQCPPWEGTVVITSSLVEKVLMANNDFDNMEPLALASITNLTASSRELEVNLEPQKLFKINKVRSTTKIFLHLITP